MMTLMRDLFVLDPNIAFLNHGSFGACPKEILQIQFQWQLEMEKNPVEFLSRSSARLLRNAREELATYLTTNTKDLVFIANATTGVNIVAQSLPLHPGDEVLTTNLEYGACDAAWQHICNQRGARYRKVEIPLPYQKERVTDRIFSEVNSRTKVIYLSHISSGTALILPVEEICRKANKLGILTVIDGAHAPGQIDVNIESIGADFYTGNCHKWLCSPKGAGFLHAKPQHQTLIQAPVISWAYAQGADTNPAFNASLGQTPFERKLQWLGTNNISACLTVPSAIEFQQTRNWPEVRKKCHELAKHALDTLTARFGIAPIATDADWAQMVAIPVPKQNPEALQNRLFNESAVEVPVTTHDEFVFVRVSVQGYNTSEDIERLLDSPALR